ncbi:MULTISPECIES: radical SAM protein [Chryseobacterium]|uniref:Radical SAM core domain-containing protein n=1 Tax=Candidatus Chryseobacterium massiliense TaxID=204089 RepID=A0A3D9AYV6_9FLAO|nr:MULTISPECIES: radical SAM protein [Chryseobacterium]REC46362.1 hypothetical protein DRF68_14715 [Candidatus Chryseobacterium massiliae]
MNIEALVVKVAGRCNINCTYCYMYNHADQSYKLQPKFMSKETILALKEKIKNHCHKHSLKKFFVVLHGGEPLLMNIKDITFFLQTLHSLHNDDIEILFAMQTNGMLLSKEHCELFSKYRVGIGVSLDGGKEVNDKFRIDKKGKGTFDRVKKGMDVANKYLDYKLGCLSVINFMSSPVELYETYRNLGFSIINLLLLDENYDSIDQVPKLKNAEWLIELFDYWYNLKDDENKVSVIKFEDYINYIFGSENGTESSGKGYNKLAVIETNGDIESLDVLKICGESFTKHKFNLHTNEFDDIFQSDLIDVYYNSKQMLPKKCLACPIHEVCGGGYLPHRYSSKNGFNNPSIYCNDLLMLITHIQNKVIDSLPEDLIKETGIQKLTYEDALKIIDEKLPTIQEPSYAKKLESFAMN